MTQYLIAIYRPHDDDPALEDAAMGRAIDALNDDMVAAGVRLFVGGLQSPSRAHALRVVDGVVRATAGPCVPAGDHVGGLWVLEVASEEEALAWGSKAALACRARVEVRPFH